MLTVEAFAIKYKKEIDLGVVIIDGDYIIADRYVNGEFLIERSELNKIQADIRKMGYVKVGFECGTYLIESKVIRDKTIYQIIADAIRDNSERLKQLR